MNSIYTLTTKQSKEPITKIEALNLTEAIILFSKIKRLNPDKLLSIYKVIKQKDDYGRQEAKG